MKEYAVELELLFKSRNTNTEEDTMMLIDNKRL